MQHNFPMKKKNSCGESAIKSILSMYGKKLKEPISEKNGTSTWKITETLKEKGIKTKIKDKINYDSLKSKDIIYYPKDDHWLTVEKIEKDKILVNDSSLETPNAQWIPKGKFLGKWRGYAIETMIK